MRARDSPARFMESDMRNGRRVRRWTGAVAIRLARGGRGVAGRGTGRCSGGPAGAGLLHATG